MYVFMVAVLMIAANAMGAGTINEQHSGDVIQYLWWTVGIFGAVITSISGGVAVWAITKIIAHEKDIAAIKAGCHNHRRSTDQEES